MFPTAHEIDAVRQHLAADLARFAPELALCGGIVLLLLARLVPRLDRVHLAPIAVAAAGIALALCVVRPDGYARGPTFSGMLVSDPFATYARAVVLAAALLVVLLTDLTGIPDREDSGDFYVLLLGGTLGMALMASADHLLMVFVAVEMASLPSYALAGFLKGKTTGSEAALKYVVYGAAASGVMLYGISLLAGTSGTGSLPAVAAAVAERVRAGHGFDPLSIAGLTFAFVGFGFKLAAVPFHFWCPDVFEGAAAEVAGFLSVASKAAAVALTVRVLMALQAAMPEAERFLLPGTVGAAVGAAAALTVTFGNLAAFGQTNLKRLLAYSTVAHAGYMLLAVSLLRTDAVAAVLFYLAAYAPMNLGAFAVVALVRNRTGSEQLDAYRGLVTRSPVLAVALSLCLLALLGLPPLAGFAGKFQLFAALYAAARDAAAHGPAGLGTFYAALLGVGALNTALGAYYYLKVIRAMVLDDPEASAGPIPLGAGATCYLAVLMLALFAIGLAWDPLMSIADRAAGGICITARVP